MANRLITVFTRSFTVDITKSSCNSLAARAGIFVVVLKNYSFYRRLKPCK